MVDVWECFGHGMPGIALISAGSRELAQQGCYEWLGWRVSVAFRKPLRQTLWCNAGGTAETPVVYAADGKKFAVLRERVDSNIKDLARAAALATTECYWEDKL